MVGLLLHYKRRNPARALVLGEEILPFLSLKVKSFL